MGARWVMVALYPLYFFTLSPLLISRNYKNCVLPPKLKLVGKDGANNIQDSSLLLSLVLGKTRESDSPVGTAQGLISMENRHFGLLCDV